MATAPVPNIYVSAAGDDANMGATTAAPLLTLAAAKTKALTTAGAVRVWLRRGDTWRESYDEQGTARLNTSLGAYGSGSPPVVSAAVVVASWAKTAGRTNVYETTQSQNSSGTNRAVVVVDGLLSLTRVASVATCDSTPGSYYNADASAGASMVTYIHPTGSVDPNGDGRVYEVAVREVAVRLASGGLVTGLECGPAMSNNGAIEFAASAVGCQIRQAVARYGTKHNALLPGGSAADLISLYVDGASASETGVLPLVCYRPSATGYAYDLTRCHAYDQTRKFGAFYSHSNNDPTAGFTAGSLSQCVVRGGGDATPFGGGADVMTISNCCGVMLTGGLLAVFADTFEATRLIGTLNWTASDMSVTGHKTTTPTGSFTGCAVSIGSSNRGFLGLSAGNYTWTRCALVANNFTFSLRLPSGTTGSLTVNRCLIQNNNCVQVPSGGTYVGDYNVFVRPAGGTGPFGSYHGTTYNLSTNLAGWQAATGQDAHSIVLTSSPFTGTPANGDFRFTASALTGAGHDGDAGPSDHWDYNLRAAVAGPPEVWPTIPTTLAEARTYVLDPTAWDYYP